MLKVVSVESTFLSYLQYFIERHFYDLVPVNCSAAKKFILVFAQS
jgi:hypothetical protein